MNRYNELLIEYRRPLATRAELTAGAFADPLKNRREGVAHGIKGPGSDRPAARAPELLGNSLLNAEWVFQSRVGWGIQHEAVWQQFDHLGDVVRHHAAFRMATLD